METTAGARVAAPSYDEATGYDEPTGWTGWIVFASIMMIIGGSLNAVSGLIAIVNDDWVVWTNSTAVLVDVTAWGWALLIIGTLVLLSGIGVLSGNILARTVGVIAVSLNMIVNFFFIPVYPFWALTVITIDALVIWALTAHGREMKAV